MTWVNTGNAVSGGAVISANDPDVTKVGLGSEPFTAAGATIQRALADRFAQLASAQDFNYNGANMLAAVLAAMPVATAAAVNTPQLWLRRSDNSPPVSGAGILNPYLAPQFRVDMISQSGGVTGSQCAGLFWAPSVKGKTVTTLTAPVTGSGSPQTIAVADSSVFAINDVATVDLNQGTPTESVTITGISDGTHVTGIFTKSHSSGAKILVAGKGDKIGLGVSVWDKEDGTNTNSIFGINPNVIAYSRAMVEAVAAEIDVTNASGGVPGNFVGDVAPWIAALLLLSAGANDSSVGLSLGTASAVRFLVGVAVESAKNFGIAVTDGPSGGPTTGISVQSATTTGLAIGSNQTSATNPAYVRSDPTVGILLTSRGTSGTIDSNILRFQSLNASASRTMDLQFVQANSGLAVLNNGSWNGNTLLADGRVRAVGFANTILTNSPANGGSYTPDVSAGSHFVLTAGVSVASFTVNAPVTNLGPALTGQWATFTIKNASGGALAVTWNAAFKIAWTNPANANNRSATFAWDGVNWIQVAGTPADVPN